MQDIALAGAPGSSSNHLAWFVSLDSVFGYESLSVGEL